jgi:hypothetical protein
MIGDLGMKRRLSCHLNSYGVREVYFRALREPGRPRR